jgi:hypothetical protein
MSHPRDIRMVEPLKDADIRATELVVSEDPVVICPGIDDREFWDKVGSIEQVQALRVEAERLKGEALPETSDELYLDFSKTGNRIRYETVCFSRRDRLMQLTVAECIENHGRYLPVIEHTIRELCKERTWILPAHDFKLRNYKGSCIDIDLFSAIMGFNITTIWQLLSSRLSRETKELIETNVGRRIIEPYRTMIQGERTYNWWLTHDNNWNPVCLAGVTGSALMLERTPVSRALFIAAAVQYSRHYFDGFADDGCCSEGVGYWNFGFTNYIVLAHMVSKATNGSIDLCACSPINAIADYGKKIEIINSVYPAFADCVKDSKPSPVILEFFARRGRCAPENQTTDYITKLFQSRLYEFAAFSSLLSERDSSSAIPSAADALELRTQFNESGVIICRPSPGSPCKLGLALKAGHNQEMHNHNDIGSYVVVVNDEAVLLDPGSEVYTQRTFSPQRYESTICNSYGHPVPVVAETLQPDGREYQGRIIRTEFTDERDTVALDVREAYTVPSLEFLQRTFAYSRLGTGIITITDTVTFNTAERFETALISMGSIKQNGDGHLHIQGEKEGVQVSIECSEADFEICTEEITEDLRAEGELTRIGIRLVKPVVEATVKISIRRLPD